MSPTRYGKMLLLMTLLAILSGTSCVAEPLRLWEVQSGREVSLDSLAKSLGEASMIFVGEFHDRPSHHDGQLQIIQALHDAGKPVAVGLEMFTARDQAILDRWIQGTMAEGEFVKHFQANWGESWRLYRDIFLYCRERKIPMVGLNVPREITAQVAKKGFASLTREQVGMLPPITCNVNSAYMELMRQVHGHAMNETDFTQFCEAQLVWDTSMAVHALRYLEVHKDQTLVVLTGAVHAWKQGVPRQVRKLSPHRQFIVILPEVPGTYDKETVSLEDCDFLLLGV